VETDNGIFRELTGTIAIDTETHDPFLKTWGAGWARADGGRMLGVVVTDALRSDYLPIGHADGNMDKDKVIAWLKSQLKKPDLTVVFANASYDLGWLSTENIKVNGKIEDVLIAAAMLDENKRWNLDAVALDCLGVGKEESQLNDLAKQLGVKNIKENMARLNPNQIKKYAEQDGRVTLDSWKILQPKLKRPPEVEDLPEQFRERYYSDKSPKLFDCYNMEMDLTPVLIEMRRRGVPVDVDEISRVSKYLKEEEARYISEIKRLSGMLISPTESASIVPVLEQYGVVFPRTKKTNKPSVTNEFLDSLEETLEGKPGAEIPRMVIRSRKINKVRSTFVDNLLTQFVVDGRVHCSLNQLPSESGGAVSGRFSCVKPNLQQQPSPDKDPELGGLVRSIYLPEPGATWGAMDYSQQEPRLTVHYAALLDLPGAKTAMDKYNNDPHTDYHSLAAELTGLPRKQAKTINLGIAYGMGGPKLCRSLGLPTQFITRRGRSMEVAGEVGQEILNQYDIKMPFVKELSRVSEVTARRRGFIRTIGGRHCRFPLQTNAEGGQERGYTYRAMNRLIQGSAADQTKRAMIELHRAGITLLVTVHDEVGISAWTEKEIALAKDIMENCVPLLVPSKVDAEVGESWGKSK
jgi:DNA polymerase I-like protein with 3'-5' exonuclease and polymerase domains